MEINILPADSNKKAYERGLIVSGQRLMKSTQNTETEDMTMTQAEDSQPEDQKAQT